MKLWFEKFSEQRVLDALVKVNVVERWRDF